MPEPSWKSLFGKASPQAIPVPFRVFRKGGRPAIIAPLHPRVSSKAVMSLYPAQTPLARIAQAFWSTMLLLRLGPGCHKETLRIDPEFPLIGFLRTTGPLGASVSTSKQVNHSAQSGMPLFAVFAGNPFSHAPRFLVQVFDASGAPQVVVKCGLRGPSSELVDQEADFLEKLNMHSANLASGLFRIPRLLGRLKLPELHAFAMSYEPGTSPRPSQFAKAVPLLISWKHDRSVPLSALAAWRRLQNAIAGEPLFHSVRKELDSLHVSSALFHGDFAPWNIKVSGNGVWTILDWERGEIDGPPAWDWFHFELQWAALVQKKSGTELVRITHKLLSNSAFKEYASQAGLLGQELAWLKAYLLYCKYVLKPKEGSPRLDSLLNHLSANA